MQTRCHKKRFIAPMLFAALMLSQQQQAYGQFNKYRSQTRFSPDKKPGVESSTPDVDTMSAEDAAAALKAAEKLEQDAEAADAPDTGDSEESDNESAFQGDSDDDANKETFGTRPNAKPAAGPAKSNKYVNLNPETAFGPEIVESFDFPDTDIMEITRHMQKL